MSFFGFLDTVATVGTFGLLPAITGSDSPVSDFFGVTQTEATKDINDLKQKQADLEADRQRRALARQAVGQQQALRAQQAVSGASSTNLLSQQQVAGGLASQLGYINTTQQLGKEITAKSKDIADANQTKAIIGAGIDIAMAVTNPATLAKNLTGIQPGGGAGTEFRGADMTGTVDTGTRVSSSGALSSPAPQQTSYGFNLNSGGQAVSSPANKAIITF